MRVATCAVLAIALIGCQQSSESRPAEPKEAGQVKPKAAPPKPKATEPTAKTKSDKPKPALTAHEQFEVDWKAALAISDRLDKAEPAETARVLKLLDSREVSEAENAVLLTEAGKGTNLYQQYGKLSRAGLTAYALRYARKNAREDGDFKKIAREFWEYDRRPEAILDSMQGWGALSPQEQQFAKMVVLENAPLNQMPPGAGPAVRAAGGTKWLLSKK